MTSFKARRKLFDLDGNSGYFRTNNDLKSNAKLFLTYPDSLISRPEATQHRFHSLLFMKKKTKNLFYPSIRNSFSQTRKPLEINGLGKFFHSDFMQFLSLTTFNLTNRGGRWRYRCGCLTKGLGWQWYLLGWRFPHQDLWDRIYRGWYDIHVNEKPDQETKHSDSPS